jgi:hypothetical protein
MHIRDDSPASLIISVDFESDTSPGYLVYWTNNFDRETKVVIIIQFGRMAIILLSQSSSFFRLDIVRYALMRQRHGILRLPHAPPGCNAGVTQIAVVQHSLSLSFRPLPCLLCIYFLVEADISHTRINCCRLQQPTRGRDRRVIPAAELLWNGPAGSKRGKKLKRDSIH